MPGQVADAHVGIGREETRQRAHQAAPVFVATWYCAAFFQVSDGLLFGCAGHIDAVQAQLPKMAAVAGRCMEIAIGLVAFIDDRFALPSRPEAFEVQQKVRQAIKLRGPDNARSSHHLPIWGGGLAAHTVLVHDLAALGFCDDPSKEALAGRVLGLWVADDGSRLGQLLSAYNKCG